MKKLICLALLISGSCYSQVSNFYVQQKALIWETVFINNNSDITSLIQRHPRLSITDSKDNVYKGSAVEIRHTCPGTSPFLDNELSFDFEIQLTEGKYRVTVSNLKYTSASDKSGKAVIRPESIVLKKGEINKKYSDDLACVNSYFSRIFTMAPVYRNKS